MKRMPMLTGVLLVSISSLLSTLCLHSAAAEASDLSFNQSLEKVKEFHDRFKDSTFTSRDCGGLSASSWFANDAGIFGGPDWSMGGLVAVETNRHMGIDFDWQVEPSSSRANFLGIDVSRITVIAINMARGGNAVATSDITLNPVQFLVSSSGSEVECKLK